MIRIRCLGPARLEGPDTTSPEAVLAQPKRLALFAFLALSEPDGLAARDTLLGMFWPESPESSARGSLRQALRYLRRGLGDDVLQKQGRTRIGVNRGRVACDVWEFERRLADGDRTGALALYRGELLQGLELRGAQAFDQWLAGRRRQLALGAAAASWELAEEAREGGDLVEALRWARRARDINRADEDGVRRLIGLQLSAGDRAGALRTYEQFEAWLAQEFDAVPSVRTRELVERARGAMGISGRVPTGDAAPTPGIAARRLTPRAVPVARRRGRLDRALAGAVVVLAFVATVAGIAWSTGMEVAAEPTSPGSRAVERLRIEPFEVRGSGAELGFMRHGVAEILSTVFTGEVGPRAVTSPDSGAGELSPRARWRLSGSLLSDDRNVYLKAALTDTRREAPVHEASLSGPADSLYQLARELGGRLLALHGGAPHDEAALLARTAPPALRAHLLGRAAYRNNRYEEADRYFTEALRHDSLFAQAAVGLVETHLAAPWLRGHVFDVALPLAFRLRDRLGPADRELITAVAGPRYPDHSTQVEHFQAWERAVVEGPERATVWFHRGDAFYHVGPFIGIPEARAQAKAAFERALQLDSGYLPPLVHLTEIAADEGDMATARAHLARLTSGPHDPATADYLRWRVALAAGDETERKRIRERIPEMDIASIGAILKQSQFLAAGLDDAELIASLDRDRWSAPAERWTMLFRLHTLAMNRGRPTEVSRLARAMEHVAPRPDAALYHMVRAAIHSGGDPAVAADAAREIAARVDLTTPHDEAARPSHLADVCVLESWKVHRGDTGTLRQAIRWLRDPAMHPGGGSERRRLWCADFLDGLLALELEPERLPASAERLSAMVAEGVEPPGVAADMLHLLTTEVLEAVGDVDGALATVRLRQSVPYALTARLRVEGRLAALQGDTAAARAAFRHYLVLRSDPEPALREEVDRVRREYLALAPAPTRP